MKELFVRTLALVIGCMVLANAASAQTINLQLQNNYTLGTVASNARFAVGDLNNDGRPDIVEAASLVNTPVSILLNNGSGGFSPPATFGATLNASAIAVGDFNNDGFADLAIGSNTNTAGVNIRLGNGTGSFPNELNTAAVEAVTAIVAADFNGDGNLDLAITKNNGYASQPTNAVHVLFGNGSGGFGAPTAFAIGAAPLDLVVGDFNGDGKPDIAAVSFTVTNTVSVLLNNGSGSFTAAPSISWANASNAAKIVAGDFNRDCATDLAVLRSDSVAVLTGNNTGNFTITSIASSSAPVSLAVGDFNLDRKADLAFGRLNSTVIVAPGDGAGGFGSQFTLTGSAIPDFIAPLDLNLDGKPDLALSQRSGVLSAYTDTSSVFLRTDNDFDADGRADLSLFRPTTGDWLIQKSINPQGSSQIHWGISTDKPVPADYDGDFKTDIAVWRETGFGDPNRSYFFILRSSDNTLQQEQFGRQGDVPTVVGDWDGDGKADVAVYRNGATAGAQSFFFYRPSATPGFDFRTVYWGTSGDQPVRGDFDGDGKLDAAVFRPSNSLWYVMQSSNGQPVYQSWGSSTDRRVPADYDGDGKSDFAIFRPADNTWYILNSSTGTPSYRQWGTSGDSLVPGDYNGDGKAEVAVYRPSTQRWYVPPCAVYDTVNTKFGANGDVAAAAAP